MSLVDLSDLIVLAEKHARIVLIEKKMDQLIPSWLLVDNEGDGIIFGTPWQDREEKLIYREIVRELMKEKKIIAYSFVSEVWMANGLVEGRIVPASKHPGKKEAIIILATDGKDKKWRTLDIIRNDLGQVVEFLEMKNDFETPDFRSHSWMAEMI
jgi:hypothetical protein